MEPGHLRNHAHVSTNSIQVKPPQIKLDRNELKFFKELIMKGCQKCISYNLTGGRDIRRTRMR